MLLDIRNFARKFRSVDLVLNTATFFYGIVIWK